MELFEQLDLSDLIRRALAEDVGQGDITTAATVPSGRLGKARVTVKEPDGIVFCGGPIMEAVFSLANVNPTRFALVNEGERLTPGDLAMEIEGSLSGLLIGERTALNFAQLMSGIATLTRRYVDAIAGTRARIIDTRKTHPGLRAIEKYAVRVGGGTNHRFGLDSGVLIKENHIVAAGSITKALDGARVLAPHTLRIEVECETLAQVEEATQAGADAILLDNMSPENMRQARALTGAGVVLEASGGITLTHVREVAEAGVDLISVGALTHSPKAADLSMRIEVA
ncbi:MAG: carboxylating nicotinate-nucleotide diphosphorylase [Candidatus Binataceae bacterium]